VNNKKKNNFQTRKIDNSYNVPLQSTLNSMTYYLVGWLNDQNNTKRFDSSLGVVDLVLLAIG